MQTAILFIHDQQNGAQENINTTRCVLSYLSKLQTDKRRLQSVHHHNSVGYSNLDLIIPRCCVVYQDIIRSVDGM